MSLFFHQEPETRVFSPSIFTGDKQRPKLSETPMKKGTKRLSDSTPSKRPCAEIEEKPTDTTTTTTEAEIETESHKTKRTKLQRLSIENKENIPEKSTTAGFSKQLKLD